MDRLLKRLIPNLKALFKLGAEQLAESLMRLNVWRNDNESLESGRASNTESKQITKKGVRLWQRVPNRDDVFGSS